MRSLLGRYELVDQLGKGGMGEVYRARDTRLDRLVAVKVLQARLSSEPDARARFEQEARAIAALSHPNILAIYDVGDEDGVLFVVTELLQGLTLADRLRAGPLNPEQAHGYAQQLARGLSAAHARGILHRDLKPANVFVTDADQIKILDFGLAVMIDAHGDSETIQGFGGSPGVVMGTPGYMSPEHLRNQVVDERSDVFAFGAVLYEMIAGAAAFDAPTTADVVTAVLTSDPRPLPLARQLAARLERIAMRCLAKTPTQRYQSADELMGALEAADADTAVPDVPAAARPGASIAVLPLVDLSADHALGYLCDGIAEEIMSGLARVPELRVAARTSAFQFKGKAEDVRRIGQALRVDAVLEGTIRAAGQRLRITTQLVNVSDGYQLWSERFDREAGDVFAIEDEIAGAVVAALRGRLGGAPASAPLARGTADIDAYTAYLKGRHQWNKRTEAALDAAVALFQHAIDRDPTFAAAHAALADVHLTRAMYGAAAPADAMPKAKASVQRALGLDATVPGALATLAMATATYDWQWADADALFARAVQADAAHPASHHWHAMGTLLPLGRFADADRALARALDLDPLATIVVVSQGLSAFLQRRHDDALRLFDAALALDESFAMAYFFRGHTLVDLGRVDDGLAALERARDLTHGSAEVGALIGYAHARAGRPDLARGALAALDRLAASRYVSPVLAAHVHAGLADADAAIAALQRAEALRAADLVWIGVRPIFQPLRSDPRFAAIAARVGIPLRG